MKGFFHLLVIAAVSVWGVYMLLPAYTNYNQTSQRLREVEQNLLTEQQTKEKLLDEIHRLQVDPHAVERVAREKLGWSRAGEIIYDFREIDEK
ncbi:MAG: septum formation initiator family protein [Lentisphaeria bacterium]|jgi:cell division protein FtsB|nr:septum formation initiator family protein [Lentisphaeria bacterium]